MVANPVGYVFVCTVALAFAVVPAALRVVPAALKALASLACTSVCTVRTLNVRVESWDPYQIDCLVNQIICSHWKPW